MLSWWLQDSSCFSVFIHRIFSTWYKLKRCIRKLVILKIVSCLNLPLQHYTSDLIKIMKLDCHLFWHLIIFTFGSSREESPVEVTEGDARRAENITDWTVELFRPGASQHDLRLRGKLRESRGSTTEGEIHSVVISGSIIMIQPEMMVFKLEKFRFRRNRKELFLH